MKEKDIPNYQWKVSRKPPEGLLGYALSKGELDTAGLVYRVEWAEDTSMEAILTENWRKVKMVRVTCSECGMSGLFEWVHPVAAHGYGGEEKYGFRVYDGIDYAEVRDGDSILCPFCGSPAKALRAADIRSREWKVVDETSVMSASLLKGKAGERPLCLTGWRIQRMVDKLGFERYEVEPMEAYVFEREKAYQLMGWGNSYNPYGGYSIQACREWRQPQRWRSRWGNVDAIYGLTGELLAESVMANSKLDLFMEGFSWLGYRDPVVYLRLYQRHPQVENLVVQGCGHLLWEMIKEEKGKHTDWSEENKRGEVKLAELRWGEVKPARILGLDMDELRMMQRQTWGLYLWRIYTWAKAAGDRLTAEDMVRIHALGSEDIGCLIGRAPLRKCVRYMLSQCEYYSGLVEAAGEDEELDEAGDVLVSGQYLADYWDMAARLGWDLDNGQIRWPRELLEAHDRATAAMGEIADSEKDIKIKARAEELRDYIYASGELVIRPARNQFELNREGKLLSHCVAGYGADVADGKTAIFFIRHTWAQGEPYFTLELRGGAVNQNRGKHNCARTDEVQAFEEEWLAWLKAGRPRDEKGRPVGAKPVVRHKPKHNTKEADAA